MTNGILMKVKGIAECSGGPWGNILTCIKHNRSWNPILELNSLTYLVYSTINLLSLLYLLTLKIRNCLLFVISTLNLFEVLY